MWFIFAKNIYTMKTKNKTKNTKSLLNSSNMIILGKDKLKQICGGGWIIVAYYEDGELKFKCVWA